LFKAGCCGCLFNEGDGEYVATGTELLAKIVVLGIVCLISCFLNDGLSKLSILFWLVFILVNWYCIGAGIYIYY